MLHHCIHRFSSSHEPPDLQTNQKLLANTNNKNSNLRYSPKIHTWNYLNQFKENLPFNSFISLDSSSQTSPLRCFSSKKNQVPPPLRIPTSPLFFRKKEANSCYTPFKQNMEPENYRLHPIFKGSMFVFRCVYVSLTYKNQTWSL